MERIEHLLTGHPWIASLADKGLRVIVIIAIVIACAKLIHVICERILTVARNASNNGSGRTAEREKRVTTVVNLVDTSLRVILFGAALLMVLREFGVDITPLLTGAGIAGVALGFGSQSLVKDVIAGFFILIENQIRIGDVVKFNNLLSGTVERMELRVTAIRDGDGTLHMLPNGEIKSVSNMTYEFSQAVVELPLPYSVDLKKLAQVLTPIVSDLDQDPKWKMQLRGKPEFLGISKFEHTHMTALITVKTDPHSRWTVDREIRRRVKIALDDARIELLGVPRSGPS